MKTFDKDISKDLTNYIPQLIREGRRALKLYKLVSRNKLRKWGYLPSPWKSKHY